MMKKTHYILILGLLFMALIACNDKDVPEAENEEEIITDVRLIFNPTAEGGPVSFLATDPDGEGPGNLEIEEDIVLTANTSYQLFIELSNEIAGEDITVEIKDEGDEHKFFFAFTEGLFSSPGGDGNTDNPGDQVLYIDKDENDLGLGLITGWVTGGAGSGNFRVILKHQPGIKTDSSSVQMGETDLDVTWPITIE